MHEFAGFERKLRAIARQDDNAQRLMTTPGVGVLMPLTFVAAVDAPERYRSSRAVGPHFGFGDGSVRTALYEAANGHPDATGQRFRSEGLGVGGRQTCRPQKGARGAGPQAGGGVALHAQGQNQLHSL
ncbi:hypothetical protein AB7M37_004776 [Sinorhizobium fredii]